MDYYYAAESHHDHQQYQSQYPPPPPQQQQQEPYDPAQASLYDPASYDPYHHYYNAAESSAPYHPPDAYAHMPPAERATPQQQQHGAYAVPPGLNPAAAAAVAALSQLSQFAGTMDAAERAMVGMHSGPPAADHYQHPHHYAQHPPQHGYRPPIGGPSYSVEDRRGGGTFRGRGRSNFGNHSSRPDGGSPPFHGRGRGRGRSRGRMGRVGGRRSHQSTAPDTQAAYEAPAPAPELAVELLSAPAPRPVMEPSSMVAPLRASSLLAPGTMVAAALPKLPLLPVAWCDICRVDCNSLEILEQHKNGKRHKRTVQRIQEIQAQQKLINELQAKVTGKAGMVIQTVEDTMTASMGEASRVFAANEQQSSILVGKTQLANSELVTEAPVMEARPSEVPTEAPPSEGLVTEPPLRRQRMDGYDRYDQRNGPKRNLMRCSRGGKRIRYSEPPVRAREQPRVCTLCNCMCDTLLTFEAHLAGKKHISRIRRFQGHGMVYGPVSVYIPPNQPRGHTPQQGLEPLFFGLTTPEMIQQGGHVYAGMAVENFGHQQAEQPGEADQAKDEVQEVQVEQELKQKGVAEIPDPGLNAVTDSGLREFGPSSDTAMVESEVAPTVEKALAAPESGFFPVENVASNGVKLEDSGAKLPVQESGGFTAEHIILPGSNIKVAQPGVPDHPEEYGALPVEYVPFSAIEVKVEVPNVDDNGLANGECINLP